MQKINVLLLVEDDDNDIILTERKIQRSQLPVGELVVARSLAEARRVLAERPIDVVLLDLNLGDSQGLDTLKALRGEGQTRFAGIVIVLTSIDDELTGIDAIRLGADDYLVKGRLTEDRLRTAVAYAAARHAARETARRMADNLDRLTVLMSPGGG